MPTVIIKSGSTAFADAIVKGNFSYYVDPTIDLGPSESTGFYMGVEPPAGGYSIYKTANIDNGWTVRTATDSSSLNSVLKSYGAPHETVNDNIDWASANNDVLIYSGGTPSYYTWNLYYGFPFQICGQSGPQMQFYTSGTPLGVGTELFTDTSLSQPFSGGTQVGFGNTGDYLYGVNPQGVILGAFQRCNIYEGDFGTSNVSQLDSCLANSIAHLHWSGSATPYGAGILYTDGTFTTPYTGSLYVSYDATAMNVNQTTGQLSNQNSLGYYYGSAISSCPGCGTIVGYNDVFSPSAELPYSDHYAGTFEGSSVDIMITSNFRYNFIQRPAIYIDPNSSHSVSCMCP